MTRVFGVSTEKRSPNLATRRARAASRDTGGGFYASTASYPYASRRRATPTRAEGEPPPPSATRGPPPPRGAEGRPPPARAVRRAALLSFAHAHRSHGARRHVAR